MNRPLRGRRIGLLTANASRLGGGVFEAVVAQAEIISALGGQAAVFALDDAHAAEDANRLAEAAVSHVPVVGPAVFGFAPALVDRMLSADLDLLHLHGIWMYPSLAGLLWARRTGRPYVISPHGMLDPWITARGRTKKAVARLGYERASWSEASALHALTEREARDIAAESGRHDAVVIPNAGPLPDDCPKADRQLHLLYLGRIHPKKNIDALIAAWAAERAALEAAGAKLTIAGWGADEHVAALRNQLRGAPPSINFIGPVFGERKAQLLGDARFLVLPSHSEGLPMVVLEAWSAGTPAIMTSECNLPDGFAAGAALDCGFTAGSIAETLRSVLAMDPDRWAAMSAAGRALAGGPYSLAAVTARWGECYAGLAAGKPLARAS